MERHLEEESMVCRSHMFWLILLTYTTLNASEHSAVLDDMLPPESSQVKKICCPSDHILAQVNPKVKLHDFFSALIAKDLACPENFAILDLSNNHWTSEIFTSFTNAVIDKKLDFGNLEYLVLRYNKITKEAAGALYFWLKLPKIKYVNLFSNPLSLKRIGDLSCNLCPNGQLEEPVKMGLLRKVIFMSESYVSIASNSDKVKIYDTLVKKGILPSDWAAMHREFYRSSLFKDYEEYVARQSLILALRNVLGGAEGDASDEKLLSSFSLMNSIDVTKGDI